MLISCYLVEIIVISYASLTFAQVDTDDTAVNDFGTTNKNELPFEEPKKSVVEIAPVSMEIFRIVVPPGVGNAVRLEWSAPLHSNLSYQVYYSKEDEEFSGPRLTTSDVSVTIENLEFCTKYKFAVSIVSDDGGGDVGAAINPNNVRSVVTYMDRLAPPKDLLVEFEPREVPCLLIKWSASCPNIGQPIGYVISAFRHSSSNYIVVTLPASNRAEYVHHLKTQFGEKLDIKVSTNFPGSRSTEIISYKVPHFLQPYKVRIASNADDGAFLIYWLEPFLPYYIDRAYYEVYIYRGANVSNSYEKYYVTRPVLVYKGNESVYTFSVGTVSYDGRYKSLLTDPITADLYGEVREIEGG